MQEIVIALPESIAILAEGRRRHGRIAEARVTVEDRGPVLGNIVSRSFQAVMQPLLEDCSGRNGRRWRRNIHRRRMRAADETQYRREKCRSQGGRGHTFHVLSPEALLCVRPLADETRMAAKVVECADIHVRKQAQQERSWGRIRVPASKQASPCRAEEQKWL